MEKLDILNRDAFVEELIQLTENIANNKKTTSFAIDGDWGCGKSFVLDMFEEKLAEIQSEETATDKYFIVRYNCWKYDYYEEPLIAIVAAILDVINEKTSVLTPEQSEKVKGILKAVGATLLSMANSAVKAATNIDFGAAIDVVRSGLKAGKEQYEKMQSYDIYFSFNQALQSLRDSISQISNEYTIVFLIDELDRCLPEYAIKVLERLHHLTENETGIISIMAIDKKQLKDSVRHIFGFNNPDDYLKKFIHFTVPLNVGTISEKITEKYRDYISLFDQNLIPITDSLEEFMQAIFKKIDARTQEQIFLRTSILHKLLYDSPKDYTFMCMELLIAVLKTCYRDIKKFTTWFNPTFNLVEGDKKEPPFASFFEEKFKNLHYKRSVERINNSKTFYAFTSTTSLYSAIAYMWFSAFFGAHPGNVILGIDNTELLEKLRYNVTELKQFADMIHLIK